MQGRGHPLPPRARYCPPRKRLRATWLAALFFALLAFTSQSFLVQTHVHLAADNRPVASGSYDGSRIQLKVGRSARDAPAPCPLCQELADAGTYLLPDVTFFEAPRPNVTWYSTSPAQVIAPRQRSHAWRSRAPPRNLQA